MRPILTTIFFFLITASIFSQTTISGVVVSEISNEPLAFANVYTEKGEGGITNERGRFEFKTEQMPEELFISYVGYISKKIKTEEGKLFYPIKIKKAVLDLVEVNVLANDDWAATVFYNAIEHSRKLSYPLRHAQVFRRTYSTIDNGTPVELMESFYNSILTMGGVRAFNLKNGRIGIPLNSYILQLDMCKILEHYNFYGDEQNYFPKSPLQEKSKKKLKKGYYIRYVGSTFMEQDTIYKISFECKKKGVSFDGVAYINKNKNSIVRVLHQVENAAHVPFYTVLNKEGTSVENMAMKWDTGFEHHDDIPLPKYMHLVLDFDYLDGEKRSPLKTNTKLFFYDYENKFELPLFGDDEELNDYDKIMATPYNAEFWKRTPVLPETGMEERFRKDLEHNDLFMNADPASGQVEILNQQYQLIFEGIMPNWGRVAPNKQNTYSALTQSNLGTDNYNCLFAQTFLALDYNCFNDTSQFTVQAVLNYGESFMCDRNEREAKFFIKFLDFAHIHALELEKHLAEKYLKKCPTKNEITDDLYKANKALRKEIFMKFNGRNLRTDNYLKELGNMLEIRKSMLKSGM